MASTRATFTLDKWLASRQGVADAVHDALLRADRDAYVKNREDVDGSWADAEEWGET